MRLQPPDEDWALDHVYWVAILSDNSVVYEDYNTLESWIKFKNYLQEKHLRITKFILKFRSHEIHFDIPSYVEYVYLSKGIGKWAASKSYERFIIFGIQDSPVSIVKHWYVVPELIEHRTTYNEINLELEATCKLPMFENSISADIMTYGQGTLRS